MSRAIVHKTKGKLDLRALTIFGMNAKPETETPIGYFGTGLKYAVAVLSREKIPMAFWIDNKQWVIEKDPTAFRGKPFDELYICSVSLGGLIKKRIKLPFTTELGKNWELWQAFRELESNTRDEKGETWVGNEFHDSERPVVDFQRGHTYITVEDERYVQCWLDRDKTFLPDGLTARTDSTGRMQAFARKSQYVYYRGIRIHDLKEPSENTYNILSPLTLTEDRTCKFTFEVDWAIEQFLQDTEDEEVANRAIKAPAKSFEGRLSYDYTTISDQFLDRIEAAGKEATQATQNIYRSKRPPVKVKETYTNWIRAVVGAIERGDYDTLRELAEEHKEELLNILRTAASTFEKEEINNNPEPEEIQF